ncbi:hypothetical protein [Acetobacterium tundrae]|uniref:Uncharacterized protein n=1 Tax=Acetobacterium tundrae TaxID=132932 RepID=A0ABR6WHS0_9FIRM|nr:hypothetical protein [Acetobacterium tundrae]MBC3796008.1 hypothetical protein [Acetobacterium tundrae]
MNKMQIIMETRFLDIARAIEEYTESGNKDVFICNVDKKNEIDRDLRIICAGILGLKNVIINRSGNNSWYAEAIYENQEGVMIKKVGFLDKENFKIVEEGSGPSVVNYTKNLTVKENKKIYELLTTLPLKRTRKLKRLKEDYEKNKNQI